MIISLGRFFAIFMNTQCIVGLPEGKHFKMFRMFHIPLLKLLYFTCKNDAE